MRGNPAKGTKKGNPAIGEHKGNSVEKENLEGAGKKWLVKQPGSPEDSMLYL
jgi:hypothetical protein